MALRAENGEELWDAPISKWAMESGVRLARVFSSHALVVFGEMEMDHKLLMASRVLRRLRKNDAPNTVADLWRSMRNTKGLESVKDLEDIVDDLRERWCIRLVQTPSDGSGRPPSPEIELHPELRPSDPDRHPLNPLKGPKEAGGGGLVDKMDAYSDNKSGKSEGDEKEELSEEDRQYVDDERAGRQMEDKDLALVPAIRDEMTEDQKMDPSPPKKKPVDPLAEL